MPIGTNAIGTVAIGASEAAAASPSITDINTNEEITNAQTGNTITYADFDNQSGTFTLALRSTADANASTDCTNVSLAAGSGTFDAPDLKTIGETPVLSHPLATTTNNDVEAFLEESIAAQSASLSITLLVEAGYEAIEVVSASTAEGSILENVTLPIVDESIMIGGTDNNSALAANGIVTTDQTTGTRDYWLWKKDAGTAEKIIFNLGGSIDPATLGPESKISLQLGISL